MNFESVMLRGAVKMFYGAKQMDKAAKATALKSHKTAYGTDTMEQCVAVLNYVSERERMRDFCRAVGDALAKTSKCNRALLIHVYIKGADKEEICKKYGVSKRALYRKLEIARLEFKQRLVALGFMEQWLLENYGDIEWVGGMLNHTDGKGKAPF